MNNSIIWAKNTDFDYFSQKYHYPKNQVYCSSVDWLKYQGYWFPPANTKKETPPVSPSTEELSLTRKTCKAQFCCTYLTTPFQNFLDPFAALKEVREKNSNRPIIAQLNINSLKSKFDSLKEIGKDKRHRINIWN